MFCVQALQYKTDQIADIKKIEKLNLLLFTLMSQGSDAESEPSLLVLVVPGSNYCKQTVTNTLAVCLQRGIASCLMHRNALYKLQVIAMAYLPSTWSLTLGRHRIDSGKVQHVDAAFVSLQFQRWNLRTPLQLHKHKSPYKNPIQVSNPERGRKDEKADEQAWSSRRYMFVNVLRRSVGYKFFVYTAASS